MSVKYCYRCGTQYNEDQCTFCGTELYTERSNTRTVLKEHDGNAKAVRKTTAK